MDRARVALGGRDLEAEIMGYGLALAGASPEQTAHICDSLLELADTRSGPDALAIVAGVWTRLEPGHRARVVGRGQGVWPRACAIAALDPNPTARASVATLVGVLCDPHAMSLLHALLSDRDPIVAEQAGAAVLALATRLGQEPALDPVAREAVRRTVAQCAGGFDAHRRRETLGALLLVLGPTPAAARGSREHARTLLADADHPAHMVLRGMLRRGDALATREAAWMCMTIDAWRTACVDRLGLSTDADGIGRVLERGHLLANPDRSAALERSREGVRRGRCSGLDISAQTLESLAPGPAAWAPRWLACVDGRGLSARLEPLLAHGSPRVRLAALLELSRESDWTSGAGADFVFDEDARVARCGLLRMTLPSARSRIAPDQLHRTLRVLERSPHRSVRMQATRLSRSLDPLGPSSQGRLNARRMLSAGDETLVRMIQEAVRSGPLDRRIAAIASARALGLGAGIELELLTIVHRSAEPVAESGQISPERRDLLHCAAAAITLLADLPSPAAQHAVHRCLRHPDARVRANALDALARAARLRGSIAEESGVLASAIVEFKNDEQHRVRASAARAAVLAAVARERLEDILPRVAPLLSDDRPMHRISGLWLAERVAGITPAPRIREALAAAVAETVRTEPDLRVQTRARRAGAHLLTQMRIDMGTQTPGAWTAREPAAGGDRAAVV